MCCRVGAVGVVVLVGDVVVAVLSVEAGVLVGEDEALPLPPQLASTRSNRMNIDKVGEDVERAVEFLKVGEENINPNPF